MNQLYQQLVGSGRMTQPTQQARFPQMNPLQRVNAIYQAMRNPSVFVQQMMPDVPQEILNDPYKIINWLKQNRGITDEQIRQVSGMIPRF